MRFITITLLCTLILSSCDHLGDKTKKVLNKTGEAIGEGSSEFAKGVSNGVDNTLGSTVTIADALKQKGISTGKFSILSDTATTTKNKLIIYLIFDRDFNENISAKVFDPKGNEYGRVSVPVAARKGDAKFVDFIFDKRTDVESRSKFILE